MDYDWASPRKAREKSAFLWITRGLQQQPCWKRPLFSRHSVNMVENVIGAIHENRLVAKLAPLKVTRVGYHAYFRTSVRL
jgi:hypothetical protein